MAWGQLDRGVPPAWREEEGVEPSTPLSNGDTDRSSYKTAWITEAVVLVIFAYTFNAHCCFINRILSFFPSALAVTSGPTEGPELLLSSA